MFSYSLLPHPKIHSSLQCELDSDQIYPKDESSGILNITADHQDPERSLISLGLFCSSFVNQIQQTSFIFYYIWSCTSWRHVCIRTALFYLRPVSSVSSSTVSRPPRLDAVRLMYGVSEHSHAVSHVVRLERHPTLTTLKLLPVWPAQLTKHVDFQNPVSLLDCCWLSLCSFLPNQRKLCFKIKELSWQSVSKTNLAHF